MGPNTEVIDLRGRLVIPGFIESHGHYLGLGRAKMILDLTTAKSWDDIVEMVVDGRARQREPDAWISGRGWHQEKWEYAPPGAVEGNPVHDALSKVSPNNPVYPDARERPRRVRRTSARWSSRASRDARRTRPAARS